MKIFGSHVLPMVMGLIYIQEKFKRDRERPRNISRHDRVRMAKWPSLLLPAYSLALIDHYYHYFL